MRACVRACVRACDAKMVLKTHLFIKNISLSLQELSRSIYI